MSLQKVNQQTGETTQIAGNGDVPIDSVPTQGSANAVQSGGTFDAIKEVSDEIADMNNVLGAKNLLPNKASIFDWNATKLTFTKNADGSYIINATQETNNYAGINFIVDTGHNLQWLNGLILSGLTDGAHEKWALIINKKASPYTTYTACYTEDVVISGIPDNNDLVEVRLFIWNGQLPTNLVFKPMIRLASIQDDTYEPYAMTNREMTPYVQAISNPNLLDNPWFTVNQRGQSSYSTTGANYTFDRWYSYDGNTSVVQNADGSITLGAVEGVTKAVYFRQKIENTNKLLGKTVTISLLKDDNTIITATGDIPNTVPSSQTSVALAYIKENDVVIGTVAITFLANSYVTASISAYAGNSITFKAVKLELGSASTLAMDIAPNYTTELLKCQRYYVRFKNSDNGVPLAFGYLFQGNSRVSCPLSVPMRAKPSFTFTTSASGGPTFVLASGEVATNISDFTIDTDDAHQRIIFLYPNITTSTNELATLRLNTGVLLELSADL